MLAEELVVLDAASPLWRTARALYTDKATWDEWLFGNSDEEGVVDKGEALAEYVRQGRCVIMGSQTAHYYLS